MSISPESDSDGYSIYSDFTVSDTTAMYRKYASDYCDLDYVSDNNKIAFNIKRV